MGIQLHKRTMLCQKAGNELSSLITTWLQKHDLTYLEAIRCIQEVQFRWINYALRAERHPDDPERKADEA